MTSRYAPPPGVRLPVVPEGAYEPPLAPLPPPPAPPPFTGLADDYESVLKQVSWPRSKEVTVYRTERRWRAVDVFVSVPATVNGVAVRSFALSIFVYAIVQGRRTLLTSGRWFYRDGEASAPLIDELSKWMVAARGSAERYEITMHVAQANAGGGGQPIVDVRVIATDSMTEAPPSIGEQVVRSFGPSFFGLAQNLIKFRSATGSIAPPRLQVVRVGAINEAAAARYLQLYANCDAANAAGLAGLEPAWEWPMGNSAGSGIAFDFPVRDDASLAGETGPVLAVSSTPGLYTDPTDCYCYMTVR